MAMPMFHSGLAELVRRDPRYAYEAYEFVFESLKHTQQMLDRLPHGEPGGPEGPHHVSGRELLGGIRDLALQQFGFMARTVFRLWGVNQTADFGEIVFNLIEANLMTKTEEDCRGDFHAVFDLDQALLGEYQIKLDEVGEW
jgi:uncharacterized repeat protein (TIGR04138 family)